MPRFPRSLRQALGLLALPACLFAALPNPGFEEDLAGWKSRDAMSSAIAEAAKSGAKGLRIVDRDTSKGSDLLGARLPVRAGQSLTLTFEARADADFLGVYLRFEDAAGKVVKDPALRYTDGMPAIGVKKGDGSWAPYSLGAVVPQGATAVAIWVHSWGKSTGSADLDNFALAGLDADAAPLAAAVSTPAAMASAAPAAGHVPLRATPPVIILKLDDLRQIDGKVHQSWLRVADFLRDRGIKCSIGVICQTLAEATPAYADWIKTRHAAGQIEFWFHGWDHATWKNEAGKSFSEFGGRTFDEQWDRFARSQDLAEEKLGFRFATFGPGGGGSLHQDAATAQAMAKDPAMKVWLYPSPIDDIGRRLAAAGKLTILDRVWAVNLEGKVGQPDFTKFVEGYAKNPDRIYFVLQGHPTHWAGERFTEFERIIDFLVAEKAVFMTPSEYASSLGGRPAQQVGGAR